MIESSDAVAVESSKRPMLCFTWPLNKNGDARILRCEWVEDADFLIERKNVTPGLLSAVATWATAVAAAEMTGVRALASPPGLMIVVRSAVSAVQLAHVGYWFETVAKLEMQMAIMASSRILPPGGVPMPARPRGN